MSAPTSTSIPAVTTAARGAPEASPLLVAIAPAIFLLFWSGGYAAGKVGLGYTGPFTLLAAPLAGPTGGLGVASGNWLMFDPFLLCWTRWFCGTSVLILLAYFSRRIVAISFEDANSVRLCGLPEANRPQWHVATTRLGRTEQQPSVCVELTKAAPGVGYVVEP